MNERAYQSAVNELLQTMRGNAWFVGHYWPHNEQHVRQMVEDVSRHFKPDFSSHVLDVGCFNGYMSFLFRRLGYQVTGADNLDFDERRDMFEACGIGFVKANFNSLEPMPGVEDETFDAVILAQVIEHILNHPVGFLTELARVTRPGGLLLITTPQPATFMNAWRLMRGTLTIWGTQDFVSMPKVEGGEVISHPDIHYREYLSVELVSMVEAAGYAVVDARFMGTGSSSEQAAWKRFVKSNALARWLMTKRLFASNQYILARKRRT